MHLRFDGLKNLVSGFATSRSRGAGVRVSDRTYFQLGDLDALEQESLISTIARELPSDAVTHVTLEGFDEAPDVEAILDELDWCAVLQEAVSKARHYGGAAIWMVTDPDEDLSMPLRSIKSVKRLVVMDRFELTRASITGGSWLDTDPYSDNYLRPIIYRFTPAQGGMDSALRIHATRLIRLYGDPVPARLESSYDYWGAPCIERVWREFKQEVMAREGGSEALYELGGKIINLPNLAEILSNPEGQAQLDTFMDAQQSAFSSLRAWLLGQGFSVQSLGTSYSGYGEVYDRLAQAFAAAARMPITKLFGQAPGGLSTDDASAMNNWSARVGSCQRHQLTPATNQLVRTILLSSDGPTGGVEPDRWSVSWSPYEIPSEAEEAATLKTKAEALALLLDRGVISPDEARQSIRGASVDLDEDDDQPIDVPPSMLEQPIQAPQAESIQEQALNGAQITSMIEVMTAINGQLISRESGIAILQRAFQMSEQEASRLVGRQVAPSAPAADAYRIDPYEGPDDDALPEHVKALDADKRRQWVEVFNAVYARTQDDGIAMRAANGVVA